MKTYTCDLCGTPDGKACTLVGLVDRGEPTCATTIELGEADYHVCSHCLDRLCNLPCPSEFTALRNVYFALSAARTFINSSSVVRTGQEETLSALANGMDIMKNLGFAPT